MADDSLARTDREPIAWHEEAIKVRGCALSLDDIKLLYRDLNSINKQVGERVIATLIKPPEMDEVTWDARKNYLLTDAFRLTVSITGHRGEQLYGQDESVFLSPHIPLPVKGIYFNNITAWRRHAGDSKPANRFEVMLDFSKPDVFDPNPLSFATPNNSNVTITADDMTFFRAVKHVISDRLTNKKSPFGILHGNFVYDVGLWFLAVPLAFMFATYYMERWLPIGSGLSAYRWAFFAYFVGTSLLVYRFLAGYAKWAFPVVILKENKDTSWRHRVILVSAITWLFYKTVDISWDIVVQF